GNRQVSLVLGGILVRKMARHQKAERKRPPFFGSQNVSDQAVHGPSVPSGPFPVVRVRQVVNRLCTQELLAPQPLDRMPCKVADFVVEAPEPLKEKRRDAGIQSLMKSQIAASIKQRKHAGLGRVGARL